MKWIDDIPDGALLTFDSAPIIYFLEDHPRYAEHFAPAFDAVDTGRIQAAVSAITLAEVLSGPLAAGNEILAARYSEVLTHAPGWQLVPVDAAIATQAARLRVNYRLRLPDALQLATAILTRSHALVTYDNAFARIKEMRVCGLS